MAKRNEFWENTIGHESAHICKQETHLPYIFLHVSVQRQIKILGVRWYCSLSRSEGVTRDDLMRKVGERVYTRRKSISVVVSFSRGSTMCIYMQAKTYLFFLQPYSWDKLKRPLFQPLNFSSFFFRTKHIFLRKITSFCIYCSSSELALVIDGGKYLRKFQSGGKDIELETDTCNFVKLIFLSSFLYQYRN